MLFTLVSNELCIFSELVQMPRQKISVCHKLSTHSEQSDGCIAQNGIAANPRPNSLSDAQRKLDRPLDSSGKKLRQDKSRHFTH